MVFGEIVAVVAAAGLQVIPAATAPQVSPPSGQAEAPARSTPPPAAPDGTSGPVSVAPDAAPPTTSAQTVEAPPPKVGAPTKALPVPPGSPEAGVTVYQPSYFAQFRPTTAYDMVSHLPSFVEDDGDDTVRGYSGAAGNILIDGRRPVSKTDSLHSQLARILANDVDHIELIRGGANGIDMQGRTVVANIVRKSGDSSSLVVQAGMHVFTDDGHRIPNGNAVFSKRWDGRTLDLTLTRGAGFDDSVGNGRYTVRDPNGNFLTNEPAHTTGAGGSDVFSGAYKGPLAGGDLRVHAQAEQSYFKSTTDEGVATPDDDLVSDRNRQRLGELGANYERKIGQVDVEAVALQKLERDDFSEVQLYPSADTDGVSSQVNHTGETILRLSGRYSPITPLTLQLGAEGAYNFLKSHTRYDLNGEAQFLPSADVHVTETRGEFFGQATYKVLDNLTVEAGVRFETSDIAESDDAVQERSFFYAKPRFTAAWGIDKDTQLRLRVEKKVGQLDFTNFATSTNFTLSQINAGNPNLRPDQRWQYEAAIERHFWGKGSISATVTHEEITDVVDLIPVIGPGYAFDAPGNIGSGTADTLDIEGTFPLDKLGWKNAVITSQTIWRTSSVKDPVTGEDRRISSQRPKTINLQLTQDLPKWNTKLGVVYDQVFTETSYRLVEVDHKIVTPPFLQLYGEYKPTADLRFRLELTNLIPYQLHLQQDIYDGPRNTSALLERADLMVQSQRRIFIQVRKTFQ